MNAFRIFLGALFIAISAYTAVTISNHGVGLVQIFFGDMAKMAWPGQFNFDFMCFLLLSGLWVSWRNKFSPSGILLGLIAVFGGMLFLSAYLLFLSFQTQGDIKALVMGPSRA